MLAGFVKKELGLAEGQGMRDAGSRPSAPALQAGRQVAPSGAPALEAAAGPAASLAGDSTVLEAAQQEEETPLSAALLCGGLALPPAVLITCLLLCTAGAGLAVTLTAATVAATLAAASAATPRLCQHRGLFGRTVRRLQLPLRLLLRLTWLDGDEGPAEGEAGFAALLGWPAWVLPLLLVSLCWHWIDAAL